MIYNPRLIKRQCGGWLAVSANDDPLKIGVTAPTEAGARAEFQEARLRWQKEFDPTPGDIEIASWAPLPQMPHTR